MEAGLARIEELANRLAEIEEFIRSMFEPRLRRLLQQIQNSNLQPAEMGAFESPIVEDTGEVCNPRNRSFEAHTHEINANNGHGD